MDAWAGHGVLVAVQRFASVVLLPTVMGLLTAPTTSQAQQDSLPASVTADMIAEGSRLFVGVGLCLACHGADAKGLPNLGPDLTDTTWVQTDGSFEQIAAQITKGVPASESQSGVVMPPRGGSALNGEQVRAVAAYVWSLQRNGSTFNRFLDEGSQPPPALTSRRSYPSRTPARK